MKKSAAKRLDVQEADVGLRLDVFLAQALATSRSAAARLIDGGDVVNLRGHACKAAQKVELGGQYDITLPAPTPATAVAQDITLDIVYEDDSLLVINKPRGMVVHPAPGHPDGTLVNALLHHCGESLTGVGGVVRPGIVHRLDKDTSGLMLVAKTQAAHEALSAALKARQVTRIYHALVVGNLKNDCGTIDAPLGRHPVKRKQQAVVLSGRAAVTHYCVIMRYPKHTLVQCQLETGRTHQIRVHMAHIGHPIVGDPLYGSGKLGKDSQILHAAELRFAHPVNGEAMGFKAELPEYFQKALRGL
ncbi:MAG: RluA family pseudouridine synthase [Oscillospiraceae bacterium]|nr:RluA family pseudouridine synthase [Oscillospiraceae bacterium]